MILCLPVANIINLRIINGITPTQFKTVEVIPIFISTIENNVSNYHPIVLISNLAKIFEMALFPGWLNFCET